MGEKCDLCPMEKVHRVEYRFLSANVSEVKVRVAKLEAQLARGILLLVANLTGVVITLAKALLGA